VLSALPKSAHPGAKKALAEIWNAEDREHARRAVAAFKAAYGAKFAKAVAKIADDLAELLAFYDYRPSTGSRTLLFADHHPTPAARTTMIASNIGS
jgi:transposase-like protein